MKLRTLEHLAHSPYIGPSPYDENPTQPLRRREEGRPYATDNEDTAPLQTVNLDSPYQQMSRVERYFTPTAPPDPDIPEQDNRNPDRVEFFDTSLIDQRTQRAQMLAHDYTAEEIAALDQDNPHVKRLADARREIDTLADKSPRLFVSYADPQNIEYETARQEYLSAREAYVTSQIPDESEASLLAKLTAARAEYVDAGFAMRQGKLLSRRKDRRHFEKARLAYESSRTTYISEIYSAYTRDFTDDERSEFLATLNDHEQGALAGEEANLYISEVSDETKKTRFQKLTERYNKMNRWQKIAAGTATAALAGIGFGAIGGAAAIGGIVGVKFSRNYLNGEANRRKHLMNERTIQETSVLYAGNEATSREELAILKSANPSDRANLYDSITTSRLESHSGAVAAEGDRVSKEKRKVIGRAGLLAAFPLIGGTAAGVVIEHYAPVMSHGLFREKGLPNLRFGRPSGGSEVLQQTPRPSTPNTLPDTPPSPDFIPTPESAYLYDNYAGQTLTINVPSGSTIWEEVGKTIARDNPRIAYDERERLTGNIVSELLGQQPWIRPRDVAADTSFSVRIPS